MDVAGGDQIDARLGEDQGGRLATLHLACHGSADHLDQGMVTGEDPERPHGRLAQGLRRRAGLIQIDDALGPVEARLPAARGDHATHHQPGTEKLMIVGRMSGGAFERLPGTEQPGEQAPVRDVMIADDDEARIRHAGDPASRGLELAGQPLLGDITGDQDQVVGRGVGVIERGGARVRVLAAEMDI